MITKVNRNPRCLKVNIERKVVKVDPNMAFPITRFKYFQIPTPTPDGIETVFTLSEGYVSGTLTVYRDQLAMQGGGVDFSETTPASGILTMISAPQIGEVIWCNYISIS